MWASWQIVSSSSLPRVIIGAIWPFSPHKDNTMETRSFPIVLARQHDYVKPSQCRRVSTVCRRVSTVLYIKIGQSCRRRQPNYPNLRSSSVSLAYITPKASESQFRSCTMAYFGDETDRKKKAAALLLLMQLKKITIPAPPFTGKNCLISICYFLLFALLAFDNVSSTN